jgi:hypothetical protein
MGSGGKMYIYKYHDDRFRLSININANASTILEAAVLVLIMHDIY